MTKKTPKKKTVQEEVLEYIKKFEEKNNTQTVPWIIPLPSAPACPHCGYCPTCGRPNGQTLQPNWSYTGSSVVQCGATC